ncbi:hypothetical protein C823_000989 [Eubacterium plexicaudatum ASF492]|nr:hypothetical protein C823_000989 [Eubacterium plexicaudatum ASF492]
MPFRRRSLCFVFSSMHLHGCLCRQLPQRKYIFFFGGCPWHADGNRSGCGCLHVRRMCGFYKFFIFPCPSGNRRIKARVPFRFCIDTPSIWGFGAFIPARTVIHFAAGQRAAPFAPAAAGAIAPVYHPVTGLADGCSILIDYNFIRNGFRYAAAGIQVDKR